MGLVRDDQDKLMLNFPSISLLYIISIGIDLHASIIFMTLQLVILIAANATYNILPYIINLTAQDVDHDLNKAFHGT